MSNYLSEVRAKFDEALEAFANKVWAEIVEPAIKESYKNGLKTKPRSTDRPQGSFRSRPDDEV